MMYSKAIFASAVILMTIVSIPSQGQERLHVAAQVVGGLYVLNSNNSLPLLESGKFIGGYGLNTSVSCYLNENYDLAVDLQYFRSNANNPLVFNYSSSGAQAGFTSYGKVTLNEFASDIGLRYPCTNWLQLGLGPSFAAISRTTEVPFADISDRLNSYCLGAHGVAAALLPFNKGKSEGFYWYFSLKLRYLHSLFFDARGRNLGNYNQSFLTTSLAAGIGYAF